MAKIQLTVVSQEKQLLSETVDSVTAPGSEGEMTILPDHLPLFSPLAPGVLVYRTGSTQEELVISKGFIDVAPSSQVTVIVDTATYARDISLEKAEAAVEAAHKTMANTQNREELLMAEASLKQALLEAKVARRSRKSLV